MNVYIYHIRRFIALFIEWTFFFTLFNFIAEFSIDNKGLLFSDKEFDFDNGTKVYYIEVDVSDGINSDQTTVVVTIININDNQPVFAKHTFYTKVKEDITLTSMKVLYFLFVSKYFEHFL